MIDSLRNSSVGRPYRHVNLLLSLLLVIGASPFFGQGLSWVLEALLFLTLVAGAFAASPRRGMAIALTALGALAVGARACYGWLLPHESLLYGTLVAYCAFFLIVGITLVRSLFARAHAVTSDMLLGAFSVYLILGIAWTMIYALLERVSPGSFLLHGEPLTIEDFSRFMGFSIATLTTLGYGNMSPATPQADALTSLEAIAGQFYLALVIARFVAMQLAQGTTDAGSLGRGSK